MRCLFKNNIPLVELVLRIITGKPDLVIMEYLTQKDMKRLVGVRLICLDACGADSLRKKYDIEIQRAEGIKEGMRVIALRVLNAGKYALEEIVNISGLLLEEVKRLQTTQGL